MRPVLFASILVLVGCASPGLASGGKAPDFALPDPAGKPVAGAALWAEGPVLLVFQTAWCESCQAEVPHLNELRTKLPVVAVCTGDPAERVREFIQRTGAAYPVLVDSGPVAAAYGIQSTPTFVKVERGGTISYRGKKIPAP